MEKEEMKFGMKFDEGKAVIVHLVTDCFEDYLDVEAGSVAVSGEYSKQFWDECKDTPELVTVFRDGQSIWKEIDENRNEKVDFTAEEYKTITAPIEGALSDVLNDFEIGFDFTVSVDAVGEDYKTLPEYIQYCIDCKDEGIRLYLVYMLSTETLICSNRQMFHRP